MGALHNGHEALIRQSLLENEITVCSIFVNPIQFNRKEDLKSYPRVINQDLELLNDLGCDVAFLPTESDMYPEEPTLFTEMDYLDSIMEGKHRPGHFNGVRLVVLKLLNIVKPDRAYFGKKDLQQFVIIRKTAEILNFSSEIKGVGTIREPDGLAMSSRNRLLNESERMEAPGFYRALNLAKENLLKGKSVEVTKELVNEYFKKEGQKLKLEYFEIVDSQSLQAVNKIDSPENISLCISGYIGNIRLIDNISLQNN